MTTSRRIALGSDHAGVELKQRIKETLRSKGIEVVDMGTEGSGSVDYPDFAKKVAAAVSTGEVPEGILVCGTGLGMSMTANKHAGVRAAVATTSFMAKMARAHNNANILCLGARVISENEARQIVGAWLSQEYEGGRHDRRVEKINELDRK